MEEFRERLFKENYHIVAVTETWTTDSVYDGVLSIPGYEMYRVDRQDKSGVKMFKEVVSCSS